MQPKEKHTDLCLNSCLTTGFHLYERTCSPVPRHHRFSFVFKCNTECTNMSLLGMMVWVFSKYNGALSNMVFETFRHKQHFVLHLTGEHSYCKHRGFDSNNENTKKTTNFMIEMWIFLKQWNSVSTFSLLFA